MNFPYGYPYVSPYDSTYDSFGTLRLTETDPAQTFAEPLTADQIKSHLRLDLGDTDEDEMLAIYITAAREQAEILQNRDLVRKQWDLHYDYWPEYRVRLRAPSVSVDLVQYTELSGQATTMAAETDYVVDLAKEPAVITPPWNRSWPSFTPRPSSAILIRFTSGYSQDSAFWNGPGARVKMGMLMLIGAWFEHRLPFQTGTTDVELPFGITSCLTYGASERVR